MSHPPVHLRMTGITKRFPGVVALAGVSLEVRGGEVLSLMGENGAGKSTLMKILGGAYAPDEGHIEIDGRPVAFRTVSDSKAQGIALIHQELMLAPNVDIAGNIFMGNEPRLGGRFGPMDRRAMRRRADELLARVGLDRPATTPVSTLTAGQMQMVEIAKALSADARVLIMDEPTSSLTSGESEQLFTIINQLRGEGLAIVYISHRMEEVVRLSDRITIMRDGRYIGDLSRAEATQDKIVSMMVGRAFTTRYPERPAGEPGADAPPVLSVENVVVPGATAGVSFNARRGEILGFAGLVGAGRTELMQVLFGVDPSRGGTMRLDGAAYDPASPRDAIDAGVYLAPEDRKRHGLVLPMSVAQNTSLPDIGNYTPGGWLNRSTEKKVAEAEVKRMRIKTPDVGRRVVNLSGGNQQKVVLGKWLAMRPKVLILDEPTRGIDVGAKGRDLPHDGRAGRRRADDPDGQLGHGGGAGHERPRGRHARAAAAGDPPPRHGHAGDDRRADDRPGRRRRRPGCRRRYHHDRRHGHAHRRDGRRPDARRPRPARGRPPRRPPYHRGKRDPPMSHLRRELGMFVALAVIGLGLWFSNPDFLGASNVGNTVRQISMLGTFAIGLAFVIITGGIDLSVGSIVGLTGVLLAKLTIGGTEAYAWSLWLAIPAVLIVVALVGLIQGLLITRLDLQPFIVTLGGMLLLRGVSQTIAAGGSLSLSASPIQQLASGGFYVPHWMLLWLDNALGVHVFLGWPLVIFILTALAGGYLLHFTVFGRYVYAIGGNRDAARYSGINVKRVETLTYVISAVSAGVAGLCYAAYIKEMNQQVGISYELYAIAAAVLGGCSLRGGEGTVPGRGHRHVHHAGDPERHHHVPRRLPQRPAPPADVLDAGHQLGEHHHRRRDPDRRDPGPADPPVPSRPPHPPGG